MSRSRRHHPFGSWTSSGFRRGEQDDKRISCRAWRHAVRMILRVVTPEHPELPHEREYRDPWLWRKDGKTWTDDLRK